MIKGFVLGIVVTIVAVAATVYLHFATGMAPVATSASPMPFEKKFPRIALHARLEVELYAQEFRGRSRPLSPKMNARARRTPSEARG